MDGRQAFARLSRLHSALPHPPAHTPPTQIGGPRHLDYRLLAATRCLVAKFQSEVDGRSLEQLGDWDKPLNKQNEVCVWRGGLEKKELVGLGFNVTMRD